MTTRSKRPSADQPSLIGGDPAATPAAQAEQTVTVEAAPVAVAPEAALVPATQAAPAPIRSAALAVEAVEDDPFQLSPEELADVLGNDGLGEASGEDFRIGYLVFNVLNREVELPDGDKIRTRPDQFWNTLTNEVMDEVEGFLVAFSKTHDFSRFNNKVNQTERFCRSDDRVTGTALRDFSYKSFAYKSATEKGAEITVAVKQGQERPCKGCPQQEWRAVKDLETGESRNVRDCSLVRNFVLYEATTNQPAVIRFKKTSARPAVDLLSRYYLGKYRVMVPKINPATRKPITDAAGKPVLAPRWVNYPLYSFLWKISLALDKSGKFALPEFKKVRMATREEILHWKGQAEWMASITRRVIEEADKHEAAAGVGAEEEAAPGAPSEPDDNAEERGSGSDGFDASKVPGATGAAAADDSF